MEKPDDSDELRFMRIVPPFLWKGLYDTHEALSKLRGALFYDAPHHNPEPDNLNSEPI